MKHTWIMTLPCMMVFAGIAMVSFTTAPMNMEQRVLPNYSACKFEFDGHSYILFQNSWTAGGNNIIHDPECHCRGGEMKFLKFDDQIFLLNEIAYIGASHGNLWEIHIILRCAPHSAFKIKDFETEKEAQEYMEAVICSLVDDTE